MVFKGGEAALMPRATALALGWDGVVARFERQLLRACGAADLALTFGTGGAVPLVGDWDGDGIAERRKVTVAGSASKNQPAFQGAFEEMTQKIEKL